MVEAVSRAATFLLWYKDPAQFYRDIYKEEPYPYQAQLLRDLADLSVDRVMVMAGGGLGKTKCLAAHALWCAAVLPRFIRKPISVIVIAGSEKQAKALYKYSKQAIEDTSELRSLVQGEPLQSLTEFRDRSCIKAVPNSLKAIQGEHDNIVIVDEAALAGDFVVQDTLRIVRGMNPNRIILLGTPTDYFSKFVEMWEDSERFPEWKRYHWSVYDCPAVDKRQLEEAKKTLSEEMFSVFVLGKPYAKTGTLIDHAKIKEACKDTPRFQVSERGKPPVAGIDWGWCVSGDTEVLTPNGWKPLEQCQEGELIVCYDPFRNHSRYEPILVIRKRHYLGWMTHISSRNLDILVKPSHPLFLLDRHKKKQLCLPAGKHPTHVHLKRLAKFEGNKPSYYEIPGYNSKRTDLNLDKPLRVPIRPFLRFLGWYLTEGTTRGKYVRIYQKKNKAFFDQIVEDIKEMGLHPLPMPKYGYIQISNTRLANFLSQLGKAKQKYIPQDIKQLDGELLEELVETMLKGDGDLWFPRFNTYSKQLAEDFLEVALKTGKYYGYIVDRKKKGYRVNLLTKDSSPNRSHYKDILWSGTIVDLEVPTGVFLARRNGKPVYLHNRHPTVLTIVQEVDGVYYVLHTEAWSREEFEKIHDRIAELCKLYQVETVYADAEDVGENQRLEARGLRVEPIPFNKEKTRMQSRMKGLFLQNRIRIPAEFTELIRQLRKYTWDTHEDDDYVDSLMLALRETEEEEEDIFFLKL